MYLESTVSAWNRTFYCYWSHSSVLLRLGKKTNATPLFIEEKYSRDAVVQRWRCEKAPQTRTMLHDDGMLRDCPTPVDTICTCSVALVGKQTELTCVNHCFIFGH